MANIQKTKGSSTVSHSIFVNLQAEESETYEEESDGWEDDEATTAERARQAAESVPLKRCDEVDKVLQVAQKWEEYGLHGELEKQQRPQTPRQKKRKAKAHPPSVTHPPKRAHTRDKSTSPPPNTFPVEVPTCNGIVVIHIPEIPGELETPREMRIYNASEPYIRAAEKIAVAKIIAARRDPALVVSPSNLTAVPALSPVTNEEWAGGALTTSCALTPSPGSPVALRARSLSPPSENWPHGVATPVCLPSPSRTSPAPLPLFLPDNRLDGSTPTPSSPLPPAAADINFKTHIRQGWQVVHRMLTTNMSLHEAQTELQKLFGDDYENDVWSMCCRINDFDPNELEEKKGELIEELEVKMGVETSIPVEEATMSSKTETEDESEGEEFLIKQQLTQEQRLLAVWVARNHNTTTILQGYHIFALRCIRGRETTALEKIWGDIEEKRLHPSVLRNAFKSHCPGYIYILAYSMLPKHTKLAAYLRTVPDLVYRSHFKYSHPGENAWSRRNERVKRQPPPAIKSHDLNMPVWMRIEDVHFNGEGVETAYDRDVNDDVDPPTVRQRIFCPDTWAIIQSGRYKGDFGIVVEDDYDETDTSIYALLKVIPRIKFPSSSRTRPIKAPLPVNFNLTPATAWESFVAFEQVTTSCIEEECTDAWSCDHQEYWMKRYHLFDQIVWGGFVLTKVKLSKLNVALRVPDDEFAVFQTIAEGDPLGKVPPLTSWTFQEKDTVILTHHSGISAALPGTQGILDLGNLPDDIEGVIEKVHDLVCEVTFKHQGQVIGLRSVAYHNLVKKLAIGGMVKLAPGIRAFKERKWTQTGDCGVYTLKETPLQLANSKGLVASVFVHPLHGPSVSVWIPESSILITLNPNNLVDISFAHAGSSSYPVRAHEESFISPETTICDLRDVSVIQRSHLQPVEDKTENLQTPHPLEYFSREAEAFRRFSCLPWLGVRVYVTKDEREDRVGWSGQVKEVVQDPALSSTFFVLIQWDRSSLFSGQFFDWCEYDNVRRSDNHALLHQFTPYTGNSPWKGVRVKVVKQGVYKDREAEVLDSRADPILDCDTVSGMSVLLYFLDSTMTRENRTAWIDYHYVRRCDIKPMRFLHEFVLAGKGSQSYYVFKLGYEPTYTPQELEAFRLLPAPPMPAAGLSDQNISSRPLSSPYFSFEATWDGSAPVPEIPETFWLLDRRIWKTLGNREIDVARADGQGNLRLSIKHLSSSVILLQSHTTRPGGGKQDNSHTIHPGIITQIPWSYSINRSSSASGLYMICNLEPHTGRLARCVQYSRAGNEKLDRWVLQLVTWTQPTIGMDHTEMLVDEPFIRTTREHFVLVHETLSTLNRANMLMCRLRAKECAPTNGYEVNGDGQILSTKIKWKSKKTQ